MKKEQEWLQFAQLVFELIAGICAILICLYLIFHMGKSLYMLSKTIETLEYKVVYWISMTGLSSILIAHFIARNK